MADECPEGGSHNPGGTTENEVRGVMFENTACTKCGARGNRTKGGNEWTWSR